DDVPLVEIGRVEREVTNEESPRAACGVRSEVQPQSHPVSEVAGQVDAHLGPNAGSGLWQIRTGPERQVRPIRECGRVGGLQSQPILRIRDLPGVVESSPGLRREAKVE